MAAAPVEIPPIDEHGVGHRRAPPQSDVMAPALLRPAGVHLAVDRFFDLYVQGNMQPSVNHALRPEGQGDAYGAELGRKNLLIAYDWLEANLPDDGWAAGDKFTMADCAAAPALFYADWVEEIGDARPKLKAYRARLLAHPQVSRAVEEARPYRPYFPLGAPDRD